MSSPNEISQAYELAKTQYAKLGVDTDAAIERALAVPLSVHCWQADDVAGLETQAVGMSGAGILATGGYPGKARTGAEIRGDIETSLSLIPGTSRVNIHAFYREPGGPGTDRDTMELPEFDGWIAWAKKLGIALDFNPTFFAHEKASDGLTLTHPDRGIREFWVRHGVRSRQIAEGIGRALDKPCVNNLWIPDGAKDTPADRWGARQRLSESLDAIYSTDHGIDPEWCIDAVEGKLFGIGSEDFTAGSNEFYSCYALTRGVVLCLDMGHFHPTESVADKLSALLPFHKRLLLHVSRPVRWDSDHVVVFNEDLRNLFLEIQRGGAWGRTLLATDYFDASINRVFAYAIGMRATRLAILNAMMDPSERLAKLEREGRFAQKLALMETLRAMPLGAVWGELCHRAACPCDDEWVVQAEEYEATVLAKRS